MKRHLGFWAVVLVLGGLPIVVSAQPPATNDEAPPQGDAARMPPVDDGLEGETAVPPPQDPLVDPNGAQPTMTTAEPEVPAAPATGCAARAREVAADSVVRVRSGNRWGAGFVYRSDRHVVTAFSLLALGRDVTVIARDGTPIAARLLARDDDYDLAVLELSESIPNARPLVAAPETSTAIGAEVIAIGHPFAGVAGFLGERGRGLLRWSVAHGRIAAVNEFGVQIDGSIDEGHVGGPLLDCEGRVVGAISGAGRLSSDVALAARVAIVDDAVDGAGAPSDFLGDMRLRIGIGALAILDEDGRAAGGGFVALGGVLFDRLSWINRVGLLGGGIDDPTETELSVSRSLVRVESLLGYRFFVDVGGFTTFYVIPELGATITHQRLERAAVGVVPTPGCTPSETESCVATSITRTTDEDWFVRPAAALTFSFGDNFELGYVFEIEVEDGPNQWETFHTLRVGLML